MPDGQSHYATNVRKAFLRGMELVGAESQKLIVIVIPVLFVDLKREPSDSYQKLNTGLPTIFMWCSKTSMHDIPQAGRTNYPGRAVYFIGLYGIGPEVYRGITTTNQQQYQQARICFKMRPIHLRSIELLCGVPYQDVSHIIQPDCLFVQDVNLQVPVYPFKALPISTCLTESIYEM